MDPLSGFFGSLIWWLFFLYLLLWPQMQFKSLQISRAKLLQRLSRKRNSTVITLIHRQESVGLFGIPFYKFISVEDSEEVLRAIRMAPKDKPIDLIIHTPGGLVLAATQIAKALNDHPAETRVIVPHYAMSGGTLIALAADKIIMDPHAVLGPVDPQLGQYPAPSIIKAVEQKGVDKVDDQTLILADVSKKALRQVREFIYSLLRDKYGDEKARELAEVLTEGRWTHDYPITVEHARELGLHVETEVPSEVYTLMELYKQPMKNRGTVEFMPYPVKQENRR
ncbi:MAG: ATP-dependent Clp protease proteolytic subunit [Palaeococcus sp.]|uniref:SDH family Clp fold serine proteinase n=1 Tax=Palaeococcus sp. (in: euryarchaeotes) TaxID=2820298 RepID=UPI0025DA5AA2|nr:ATP-dependent Clp protease proteolytic subunit [Palaeococcus sp. (in: euryarchaeotes)]MCD6559237.1 ATP-dependent Clp protease proteolytic subunit [Palaeococcus sp. (in: euryarchaeotes)]